MSGRRLSVQRSGAVLEIDRDALILVGPHGVAVWRRDSSRWACYRRNRKAETCVTRDPRLVLAVLFFSVPEWNQAVHPA